MERSILLLGDPQLYKTSENNRFQFVRRTIGSKDLHLARCL